jgi:hypothetical protein
VPATLNEKQVVQLWQATLQRRAELKTENDERVTVIYPGRRNDDRGADFKDAVIAMGQGQMKGDIEVHVKASDWRLHRHHRDPAYNRVILHVVYQNDIVNAITCENGISVPTLALSENSAPYQTTVSSIPCRGFGFRRNIGFITRTLEEAGEARFFRRAVRFRETIAQAGAGQALYKGVLTALGYMKNKAPMAELAGRVPLEELGLAALKTLTDNEHLICCQSRLLGAAGLLPSQRGIIIAPSDDWAAALEKSWAKSRINADISVNSWSFFKVRPGNHPVRRIAAMSHLLVRYRAAGLLAGLEGKIKDTTEAITGQFLEAALTVTPDDYWGLNLDFSVPAVGIPPALLGQERAADIVINVLLPFVYARGEDSEKALTIYRDYRAAAENTLIKHMRQQLGIGRYLAATACQQQGLIHLYQTRCLEGGCQGCPFAS